MGLGTEILGAIEGNQHMIAQAAEVRQAARHCLQRRQRIGEDRIKQSRLCRVEHVANMIVAGNLGDRKQALAIRTPMAMFQPPLMRQKRRALHKKHREGGHPDVAHPIGRIGSATLVRKPVQASSQRSQKQRKRRHPPRRI